MSAVLEIRDLKTYFHTQQGVIRAVDGVSFSIEEGQTLCVVGESGCGKSVTALSVMRLISHPGRIESGSILFQGQDLLKLPQSAMRSLRGSEIAMIFQEPMTSLNPVYTVGNQISEVILTHENVSHKQAKERAIDLLDRVGIPSPKTRITSYPHQMSGGMRQRVMIAMALACNPKLLIADEPTTALDVTIQAQILDLLNSLQEDFGTSILFITHNLGVVAELADEVVVMYASKVVESAPLKPLFASPLHPYTHGLFKSVPHLATPKHAKLHMIPGMVPDPACFPPGCKFHPRCSVAKDICKNSEPALKAHAPGHLGACHLIQNGQQPTGLETESAHHV